MTDGGPSSAVLYQVVQITIQLSSISVEKIVFLAANYKEISERSSFTNTHKSLLEFNSLPLSYRVRQKAWIKTKILTSPSKQSKIQEENKLYKG